MGSHGSKQGHFYKDISTLHRKQIFMVIGILGKNRYQYNFEILNEVIFHGGKKIHSLLQQLNKML